MQVVPQTLLACLMVWFTFHLSQVWILFSILGPNLAFEELLLKSCPQQQAPSSLLLNHGRFLFPLTCICPKPPVW